jgi:uracil-DNA glycosylase
MLEYKQYPTYFEFQNAKRLCRACPVGKAYNCVVCSAGNTTSPKVVVIGEAPGREEVEKGEPFIGKAGQLLRSVLKEHNFTRWNSLITNTIPCRPQDNKFPTDDSIVKNCKDVWLKEELRLTNPDFLLLVGAKSVKFLLNMEGITRIRGKWIQKRFNNKIINIMPTYHPSYVLRKEYMEEGKQIMQDFRNDIKEVSVKAQLVDQIKEICKMADHLQ